MGVKSRVGLASESAEVEEYVQLLELDVSGFIGICHAGAQGLRMFWRNGSLWFEYASRLRGGRRECERQKETCGEVGEVSEVDMTRSGQGYVNGTIVEAL